MRGSAIAVGVSLLALVTCTSGDDGESGPRIIEDPMSLRGAGREGAGSAEDNEPHDSEPADDGPGDGPGDGSGDAPQDLALEVRAWDLGDASRISEFAFVPGGDGRMLVLGHRGRLHLFQLEGDELTELDDADFPETHYEEGCGLLSVAFDVDYADNHYVYFARCTGRETNRLTRHVLEDDDLDGVMDSEVEVLTIETDIPDDEVPWHRWGTMGMEPNGVLWVLMGDGTLGKTSQDTDRLSGKLLRIVPNRDEDGSGYTPAEGNASSDLDDGRPEIYAFGLRSPWRGARDSQGRYWVGDVGANKIEELDLISEPGQNFGWDMFEGPCDPDEDEDGCEGLTNPITSYGRDSDEPYDIDDEDVAGATKRTIWISDVYEDPSEDRYYGLLDGKVLFGDRFAGWLRAVKVDEAGELVSDEFVGHQEGLTAVHLGPDGYLYATDLDGELFRLLQAVD